MGIITRYDQTEREGLVGVLGDGTRVKLGIPRHNLEVGDSIIIREFETGLRERASADTHTHYLFSAPKQGGSTGSKKGGATTALTYTVYRQKD